MMEIFLLGLISGVLVGYSLAAFVDKINKGIKNG